MDDDIRQPLENPAATASLFSRFVSQSWLNNLFKKGKKNALDDSDMYKVLKKDSTYHLANRLQRYWDHEVNTSKNPSLTIAIAKLAGIRYFALLIIIIMELAVRVVQPVFIGKLVLVFQRGVDNKRVEGYSYAAVIACCSIIESITHHPLFLEMLNTGMNIQVATSALIFRKTLRISQASLASTDTGHIINMVTTDLQKLEEATLFFLYTLAAPILLAVVSYLMWLEVGYCFLSGLLVMMALVRLQSFLGRYFARYRSKTAAIRDERIKIMNEVICGMKVIKMYAWENPFAQLISSVRRKEVKKVTRTTTLYALNVMFYLAGVSFFSLAVFLPYILTGGTFTTAKVFTVIGLFATVNLVTGTFVPKAFAFFKESRVSLERVQKFLRMHEEPLLAQTEVEGERPCVVFKNMCSFWDKTRVDNALNNISFEVSAGELLMIVGPVGCGKSSLLMALLRELPVASGDIHINGTIAYVSQEPWIFSGTLKENILFGKEYNETRYQEVIRVCCLEKDLESLVNGDETMVGERGVSLSGGQKARVNLARAVYRDVSIYIMDDPLSAVDAYVGRHIFHECIRGVLKSKVCILVSHQLQFLDDADRVLCLNEGSVVDYGPYSALSDKGKEVLSIVDVEEKEKEMENLENDIVLERNSTKIPQLRRALSLSPTNTRKNRDLVGSDRISFHDKSFLIFENKHCLGKERSKSAHALGDDPLPEITFQPDDSSIYFRNRARTSSYKSIGIGEPEDPIREVDIVLESDIGSSCDLRRKLSWQVYKDYLLAGGTPVFLSICLFISLSGQAVAILAEWWLGNWSNWEENQRSRNNSEVIIDDKRTENIAIFVTLVASCLILSFIRGALTLFIFVKSSRRLHDVMFKALLRAPIYFFDTNPSGPILNRFSKDIGLMDDVLPVTIFDSLQLAIQTAGIIATSIATLPYVAIVVVPILIVFVWIRQYFVQTSRQIKRLQSASRSPLYSHISATLQGLTTIRSFEEQPQFIDIYDKFQDHHTSAWFLFLCANRWLGFRLDILCSVLVTAISFFPLFAFEAGLNVSPVLVGLALISARRLAGMFQYCVRQSAEVENQMVSVERVLEYCHIEPEADLEIPEKKPPENWPDNGRITGENLCFKYHPSLPVVLKNITFDIKPTEKIGIVGRTGAGKSSLISSLFRLAEPSGSVTIDGVLINDIGLHDLRGKISIIPQDPVIFGGTVRSNLDPFSDHTDTEIWDSLQQVQLKDVVDNFPGGIQFVLSESGSNLSVGQRQLVCLARAILKRNKILVIDEATANVDYRTDQLIQEMIRVNFKDCTVLTIAHRLNTIMDADRIMVFDSGKVVEFEQPYELLQRPDSLFSKLVAQTGKDTQLQLQKVAKLAHHKRYGL